MTRRDRRIEERDHDPYRTQAKLPEPTVCSECAAVYRRGRWQWGRAPEDAPRTLCPACQRVRDDYPAGVLTLSGRFNLDHREEVIGLLRNVESRQARLHAQKRIMAVVEQEGELTVTTSEAGLARSLGTALQKAYDGELDYHYSDGGDVLRVHWVG